MFSDPRAMYELRKQQNKKKDVDKGDESYEPELVKKVAPKKKATNRNKHMAIQNRSPGLHLVNEPENVCAEGENVLRTTPEREVSPIIQDFFVESELVVDLGKDYNILKTPTIQITPPPSQPKGIPRVTPQEPIQSTFGSIPDLDASCFVDFVIAKDFDDLKKKVDDQGVVIESLASENERLRKENDEKQKKIDDSDFRRKGQPGLLNHYMKYFLMIENKLGINLLKEFEEFDDKLIKKFYGGRCITRRLCFQGFIRSRHS